MVKIYAADFSPLSSCKNGGSFISHNAFYRSYLKDLIIGDVPLLFFISCHIYRTMLERVMLILNTAKSLYNEIEGYLVSNKLRLQTVDLKACC